MIKAPRADPELEALLKKANDWFDSLTPDQQREHRREQRRSWVRGELMLAHPEMTREEANALIDKGERGII
jgi:hypothetical protein